MKTLPSLPHDLELEQKILSSMLFQNDIIERVLDIVKPSDMYAEKHKLIYETILDMVNEGKPVDIVTLTQSLKDKTHETIKGMERKMIDCVGGIGYITELPNKNIGTLNVFEYSKILKRKSLNRSLCHIGDHLMNLGYKDSENPENSLDEASAKIYDMINFENQMGAVPIEKIMTNAFKEIECRAEGKYLGLTTGLADIDRVIGGLHPTDYIIVAARTSEGKTSLAITMAHHLVLKENVPVLFFSLEMGENQIAQRFLSMESGVGMHMMRTGNVKEHWSDLADGASRLNDSKLWVSAPYKPDLIEIKSDIRKWQRAVGKTGVVFVDYIQQLDMRGSYGESRHERLGKISTAFKMFAKEMDIPIVANAQLNRESVKDKRPPRLHDLKECGKLEEDADVVILLHRKNKEEHFESETEPIVVDIAKDRNGPIGKTEILFYKSKAQFVNYKRGV